MKMNPRPDPTEEDRYLATPRRLDLLDTSKSWGQRLRGTSMVLAI
jgi:hypothetical protein